MSEHTYKFNVAMSCSGCSGAIDRVLKKLDGKLHPFPHPRRSPPLTPPPLPPLTSLDSPHLDTASSQFLFSTKHTNTVYHPGVKNYEVSLESQTATVVAEPSLTYETVLEKIKKTGKKVNSAEVDGEKKNVE